MQWDELVRKPDHRRPESDEHDDCLNPTLVLYSDLGGISDGRYLLQGKHKGTGEGRLLTGYADDIKAGTIDKAWIIYGEGPVEMEEGGAYTEPFEEEHRPYTGEDIRFTVKDNTLYATFLDWPGEVAKIYSLRRFEEELSIHWEEEEIESIHMLGVEKELDWTLTEDALVIKTPPERPCEHAYVFKITRN